MDFDFNLILVPVTLILGVVWLLDKFVFKQHKNRDTKKENFLVGWAYDFFPVLAVVLIVRSFIIEPFNIPSSSMVPTLYTGDFVAVNKYAYGLRLPLTYTKFLDTGHPEHGDVAVFRYPENPKIYYIKRIIGLPGDVVSNHDGQLSVNGKVVATTKVNYQPDNALTEQLYSPEKDRANPNREWRLSPEDAKRQGQIEEQYASYYQQQLGQHTYLRRYLSAPVLSNDYSPFLQKSINHNSDWSVTVPQGEYFVLGDNSDRSADGRYWGFVPDANLAGKAVYIWMHKKPGLNFPTFSRNGQID
ncbi:signal peptidase I [Psychrobacter sp. I-STPA6b]|uniref:signal peptidase I n=1 Tax=Psychrobacter sp. I-STPA6b TaxID=2585718 RepID=UPI001D0CBAF0|nr:signal peptidase I [Psychrobacter sp. I-STPA6b]